MSLQDCWIRSDVTLGLILVMLLWDWWVRSDVAPGVMNSHRCRYRADEFTSNSLQDWWIHSEDASGLLYSMRRRPRLDVIVATSPQPGHMNTLRSQGRSDVIKPVGQGAPNRLNGASSLAPRRLRYYNPKFLSRQAKPIQRLGREPIQITRRMPEATPEQREGA